MIAAALLATSLSAGAQMYRWTDSTGKTHYTDTLPPASARNVERRDGREGNTSAGSPAEPHALQVARKKSPVKLYSTAACEACDSARELLNARGVPFSEVNVEDEASIAELKKTIGSASVPTLVVGSKVQKGYEEGLYHGALDAAGYPKAGSVPPRNQIQPKPGERVEGEPEEAPAARGPYAPRR
jgi:glutaredoxin